MISMHKLTAGSGYDYLTRQVARNDAAVPGRTPLADYYDEKGEAPGVWVGSARSASPPLRASRVIRNQTPERFLVYSPHAFRPRGVDGGLLRSIREDRLSTGGWLDVPWLAAGGLSVHELTTRSRIMNTQSPADHVEYLTMREAADRYHVSVMTLRRRIRGGKLPAVQCGSKLIRISAQALDAIFTPVPNSTSWVP